MATKGQLETLNLEIKKENEALKDTVTILLKELDNVRQNDTPSIILKAQTPEQVILETQIYRLNLLSQDRLLTLEETRTLDLHIKNQRLLAGKEPIEAEYSKVPDGLSESDLIRIAGSVEEIPNKKTKRRGKSKTSDKNPME